MPLLIYTLARLALFGAIFFIMLMLHLGIFASTTLGLIATFALSFLFMQPLRARSDAWLTEKLGVVARGGKKSAAEARDSDAEDAIADTLSPIETTAPTNKPAAKK